MGAVKGRPMFTPEWQLRLHSPMPASGISSSAGMSRRQCPLCTCQEAVQALKAPRTQEAPQRELHRRLGGGAAYGKLEAGGARLIHQAENAGARFDIAAPRCNGEGIRASQQQGSQPSSVACLLTQANGGVLDE